MNIVNKSRIQGKTLEFLAELKKLDDENPDIILLLPFQKKILNFLESRNGDIKINLFKRQRR